MILTSKKHTLFLLFFPLLTFAQNDSRLVAHYPFQSNANDQSGNNNHGTVFNTDLIAGYTGEEESAYQFQHTNQSYIRVPHSSSLSLNEEMTLMAWVYYEEQVSNNFFTILEKTNPDFGGHSRYGLWVYNDGIVEVCIEPDNCPNSLCQRCLDTKEKLVENAWNHVAGTYDGTFLRTYINGKLSSEFNYGGKTGISQTNFELFLGTDLYSANDDYLNGRLDEVRIYNEALTEAEIAEIGDVSVPTVNISNTICTIYPTLTQQNGVLHFSEDCAVEQIRMIGVDGRLVFQVDFQHSIDLADHSITTGIYFLQVVDQQGSIQTKKVIVK
ncbi:MAG: LamG-like jellyroll fold domain-containing protein [Bacteroidota bacterium]